MVLPPPPENTLQHSSSRFSSAPRAARFLTVSFFAILVLFSIGCGGGGGSVSGGPTPVPAPTPVVGDFSLQVEFNQVTVQQRGVSQFLTIFLTRLQNFNGPITIALQGLPAGVTATPNGPTTLVPGSVNQGVSFSLSAGSSAAVATTTISAVGTSGSLTHTATANLIVRAAAPFHLDLSATNASLTPGTVMPLQVTLVTDPGTPSPSILLSTAELPANSGVTVSIPPFAPTPGQPTTVTLNAELLAQPLQNFPLTFIAVDNASNQSSVAAFTLNVTVSFTKTAALPRSTYLRTDGDPSTGVYDPVRKLIFTTIGSLNQVRVYSTVDRSLKAIIAAPFPQGIDLSEDGSKVYVGSNTVSQITVIDPDSLQVVRIVPGPVRTSLATGPGLDFPFIVRSLASGKVLLMASHENTTEDHIYLWDPVVGTMTQNDPPGIFVLDNMIRSQDHSKALVSGTGSDPLNTAIATYDIATDTFAPVINLPVNRISYSPDGSQLAGWGRNDITSFKIYDSQLNQTASIPALSGVFSADLLYSRDGSTLYVACDYPNVAHTIAAYNAQTLALLGIMPDVRVGVTFEFPPYDIDETGMIFRGDEMGLDFVDATLAGSLSFPVFSLGSQSVNPQLVSLTVPTAAQVNSNAIFASGVNRIFFGDPPGTSSTTEGSITGVSGPFTQITVPAGKSPGAANMTITRPDGWYAIAPDAVSYGPQILFANVGGPGSGAGGKTTIFGYGFSSSSTQVTIGGVPATNVQATGSSGAFPIPLNTLSFNAPAGTPVSGHYRQHCAGIGDRAQAVQISQQRAGLSRGRSPEPDHLRPGAATALHHE